MLTSPVNLAIFEFYKMKKIWRSCYSDLPENDWRNVLQNFQDGLVTYTRVLFRLIPNFVLNFSFENALLPCQSAFNVRIIYKCSRARTSVMFWMRSSAFRYIFEENNGNTCSKKIFFLWSHVFANLKQKIKKWRLYLTFHAFLRKILKQILKIRLRMMYFVTLNSNYLSFPSIILNALHLCFSSAPSGLQTSIPVASKNMRRSLGTGKRLPGPVTLSSQLSSTSRNGKVQLQILNQPEQQHRARYQTEGSRGAVKDRTGNSFPVVKVSRG